VQAYFEDSATVGLYNVAVGIGPSRASDDDSRGTIGVN